MNAPQYLAVPEGFNEFFEGFLTCALWSSIDTWKGKTVNLDDGRFTLASQTSAKLQEEAMGFFLAHHDKLVIFMEETGEDWERCGHIHWLSRNGHGSGWFDYMNPTADLLEKVDTTSELSLYIGDDRQIYL